MTIPSSPFNYGWDGSCAANTRAIPKSLRKQFAGRTMNYRQYYRCKNFFKDRCYEVKTAGEVDTFVFEDANEIFIDDTEIQQRLLDTNPNKFRDISATLLEANGRGYR